MVSGRGGIWGTVQESLTAAAAASVYHNSEWVYWRELIARNDQRNAHYTYLF